MEVVFLGLVEALGQIYHWSGLQTLRMGDQWMGSKMSQHHMICSGFSYLQWPTSRSLLHMWFDRICWHRRMKSTRTYTSSLVTLYCIGWELLVVTGVVLLPLRFRGNVGCTWNQKADENYMTNCMKNKKMKSSCYLIWVLSRTTSSVLWPFDNHCFILASTWSMSCLLTFATIWNLSMSSCFSSIL